MCLDQLGQRDVALHAVAHQRRHERMCLPERDTPVHEQLGEVGGGGVGRIGRPLHAVQVERQRPVEARHRRQRQRDLLDGVEQRLLVLLQVAVVAERQPLQRRQEPGEVTDQPPRLATGQLGDVFFCGSIDDPVA
jgi:hypothetical protein